MVALNVPVPVEEIDGVSSYPLSLALSDRLFRSSSSAATRPCAPRTTAINATKDHRFTVHLPRKNAPVPNGRRELSRVHAREASGDCRIRVQFSGDVRLSHFVEVRR
jgi:hypothetical protein